ncbi:MAG: dependent oxidoreductase [Acidimicrobiaceae bacterium]|nr:dependent oxidoreductase [Acidimicrobiaceae bacterium]
MSSVGIVGGGIVGLALAHHLATERSGLAVTVFEKEAAVGLHQTGHNSGVVHAGVYYRPGSLKAQLCRRGAGLMKAFCQDQGLAFEEIGKLVVARDHSELAALDEIEQRARANGVPDLRRLSGGALGELEPGVVGVEALHSPRTAITDFSVVAGRLCELLASAGHEVRTGQRVERLFEEGGRAVVVSGVESHRFDHVVVCAGLGADALASRKGPRSAVGADLRIVPFRGEYYRLKGDARRLVRSLVYPVPDPRYPFLGVHFTPRLGGEVLIGPNAVLALALEGYRRRDVSLRDLAALAAFGGSWRMARRNWRAGLYELAGSVSRRAYLERARRYVPALQLNDLSPAPSGVRAQAVSAKGELVDDFVVERRGALSFVRNAPSPAATSSFAIAEHLAERIDI